MSLHITDADTTFFVRCDGRCWNLRFACGKCGCCGSGLVFSFASIFFFFFLVFLGFSSHFIVQDARALRRQGDDALLLRKWDEAIDVLSKSILLEKENWLGFQKRASAYAGAGLLAKAIDDLNTVLSLKPDHVKSVIKRAELLVQLGKFHDAAISLNGVSGKV
jgi:tetratricopeptide (TPR) repeat protein